METLEKEGPKTERKEPDDNRDGIRRRLRDRELLKKRKAEAEEKATYQVQSKRQRVQREKSSSGKIGRPRKLDLKAQLPVEASDAGEEATLEATPAGMQMSSETAPPLPSLAPVLTQPQPEEIPIPSQEGTLGLETKRGQPVEVVLIEDLGPDENEDILPLPEDLPSDRGTIGELSDCLTASNQMFSIPATSLPS